MSRACTTVLLGGAVLFASLHPPGGASAGPRPGVCTDQPRPAAPAAPAVGGAAFDVCDVSYLWPVPETAEHARALVGADAADPTSKAAVWPEAAFRRAIEIADGDAAAVTHPGGATRRVKLPPALRDRAVWKVAGVRVDGGAPGGHSAIVAKFGAAPQLRVIVQPVTVAGDKAVVHDVAAHLVYNFVKVPEKAETGFLPVNVPDRDAFRPVIASLAALKVGLKAKGVDTAGVPLGVHPGLARPARAAGFGEAVKAFLLAHVREEKLTAMAVMGLPAPAPEPWIFVGMRKTAGGYDPAPLPVLGGKAAQMISFVDPTPRVFPLPLPTNRNPVTAFLATPLAERRGVSTAGLFAGKVDLDAPAELGRAADGSVVCDPGGENPLRNRDIPDLIANPAVAHFFNTDCISCHTESTRRVALKIPAGSRFAYERPKGVSGVDPAVLPAEDWNVRNFGWFPSSLRQTTKATVSMRTANETAECVEFINREYQGRKGR
jgi:hypothetical protein